MAAADGAARHPRRVCADRTQPRVGLRRARDQRPARGRAWVLNGAKQWIGDGSIGDVVVVWARDADDGQVKGFLVEKGTPGFTAETITGKAVTRAVWQAAITLDDARVPEESRLPGARSFKAAGRVLVGTRGTCAWGALGHAVAAYDSALTYCKRRVQFGKPLVAFQIVQDRLVKMLAEVTGMQLYCMQIARLEESGRLSDTIADWRSSTTRARRAG